MKNILKLTLALSLLLQTVSIAQNKNEKKSGGSGSPKKIGPAANTFQKRQTDINLGLYLGRNYYYYGRGYNNASPILSASVDHALTNNFSLGLQFSYSTVKWQYGGKYYYNNGNGLGSYDYVDTYRWNYYVLGLRGAFHLAEYLDIENLDPYAGIMLGNVFAKYKYSTTDNSYGRTTTYTSSYGGFAWSVFCGARYRFSDKIGIYGEFGYGIAYGNIGLNIKL